MFNLNERADWIWRKICQDSSRSPSFRGTAANLSRERACNDGFVSILTLYHRRTSPEISNRPREFAWELWERHDKQQTQEYPMYVLAYCAGKPVGVFRARSRGRAKGKREGQTVVDVGVGREVDSFVGFECKRRYRDTLCSQLLSIILRRT